MHSFLLPQKHSPGTFSGICPQFCRQAITIKNNRVEVNRSSPPLYCYFLWLNRYKRILLLIKHL